MCYVNISTRTELLLQLRMALIVIVAAALLLALLYVYPRAKGTNSPPLVNASSIPFLGPIFSPLIEFGASPMRMVARCTKEFGPVFTVKFLTKRITFLVGPEAHEPFFRLNDDYLSQDEVYGFMKPVFGPNVVYDATKKKRQVQFQSMANGLRVSRLKQYVSKIEKETINYLKENWGESGQVDLLESLSELTILTASRTLHGDDVREHLFKEVSKLYHDLDHGLTPLTVFFPNAPTEAHRKRNAARREMVKLFSKVIKERRSGGGKSDGTDILSIFMDTKYKDGTRLTDEDVTGLLIALLFAGQHTSCITSTWTSMFIAKHPDILKRVIQEQDEIFSTVGDKDTLDYEKINHMELLHNCMREALRLSPPLVLLMRQAMKDIPVTVPIKHGSDQSTTYTIPKGDIVMVSPSVAMRLENVFKDPEKYDPDRYAEGREEHKRPYSYLGFGGGMHSCMGQNFAYVQVKTILSVLFRKYEIELLCEEFPVCDYQAMVVGPKGDCRIRFKKRA